MHDIIFVEGENAKYRNVAYLDHPEIVGFDEESFGTWHFGDFGPARQEVAEATGVKHYNWKNVTMYQTQLGILDTDGSKITIWGFGNSLEVIQWTTIEEISNNREPANEPSNPYYDAQPENPGRIIWIAGPTGCGESITAKLMGKDHGYVYYECDCFIYGVNPFMDPNATDNKVPGMYQKPLKVSYISMK